MSLIPFALLADYGMTGKPRFRAFVADKAKIDM